MDEVEVKKNVQREVDLGLPPRGTGRETGRARPRLTDEERAQRHKFIEDCIKQGKTQEECAAEWDRAH